MPRVVHFEIHAENPERAVAFYQSVFGWTIKSWPGAEYWLISTGTPDKPGIDGGLIRRRGPAPAEMAPVMGYVCTVDVPNLEEYTGKAVSAGAAVAIPRMPVQGVGWLAYFKDTEGNVFGMMQHDPSAK